MTEYREFLTKPTLMVDHYFVDDFLTITSGVEHSAFDVFALLGFQVG